MAAETEMAMSDSVRWRLDTANGSMAPRSVLDVLVDLNDRIAAGAVREYQPVPLGFTPLDRTIGGGIRPGELLLIGGNIAQDIFPFQRQFLARVKELGLEQRVVVTGVTDCVEKHLATCDIFVLPSYREGVPRALLEAMYSSYFEQRGSLFDRDSLLALVASVGLDPQEAADVLDSDEFRGEVSEDQHVAAQLGASGVPFVLVDSRYAISGAQDQSVFDHTLLVAAQEGAVDRP